MIDVAGIHHAARRVFANTALLETLGSDGSGQSIAGLIPAETLIVRDGQATLTHHREQLTVPVDDWLTVLDEWVQLGTDRNCGEPQLGAIGYIGFDARYEVERYERSLPSDTSMPDVHLTRFAALAFGDRRTGGPEEPIVAPGYESELRKLAPPHDPPRSFALDGHLSADFDLATYRAAVDATLRYIRAGDIFQANITGRFSAQYEGDPFELYDALRETTPNPFFAYIDGESPVISTSPERFFRVDGARILTQPIKGTRPITIDGVDQRDALLNSEKDRAENTMIVDLMRNDIGRVCTHGTVSVDHHCALKRFNNLYHLESQISGERARHPHIRRAASRLPGGVGYRRAENPFRRHHRRAEQHRRGPYCGLIGFFGADGWVDTSIAIRTAYFDGGRMYTHAGGGITVASNADDELAELQLKVSGIRRALERFTP